MSVMSAKLSDIIVTRYEGSYKINNMLTGF